MLAMWLARKYTRAPWSEIGQFFGRRSHSTVISAHRRVEKLITTQGQIGLADQIVQRGRSDPAAGDGAADGVSPRSELVCEPRCDVVSAATSSSSADACDSEPSRRHHAQGDDRELRRGEREQPHRGAAFRRAVGVQADAELVDAEPRPGGDDVAADGERRQAAAFHEAAPAGVQHERVPEHDHQRAVFLRVPAPEAAPGVVGPQAAEHGADEAEEDREAERAVEHAQDLLASVVVEDGKDVRAAGCRRCPTRRRHTWRRSPD